MIVPLSIVSAGLLLTLWRLQRTRAARDAALARQRELESALRSARTEVDRLAAGLGGAKVGLIVLDEQGHVVATNPAAQELTGLSEGDAIGARLEELVPWQRLHEALQLCRRNGVAQSFELFDEVGESRKLVIRVAALPSLGCVVGIDDQSRIKQLESLRRDFVANVSHELKTPLAAIQGFVETMQDDAEMPSATRARFLERVARQADRLATLVGDLLTLSRLDDESELANAADPCDVVAMLQEAMRDLQPLAEKRGVALQAELPDHAVWVRADREVLRQAAGNLIDNALKYTPENGIVTVRTTVADRTLRFEVRDTGIGLSPADRDRVFERFYRVDRARSRELGGTGLGLSIGKNSILNLGGQIGVESELGVGSTFWLELPCSEHASEW